jgi:hypothetical protein
VRHQLGKLFGISLAFSVSLLACGADNDILLPQPTPPPAQNNTDQTADQVDPNQADPNQNDLQNADQLTSNDAAACEVSACAAPPSGTACCTIADDVTANRAVEAGKCGIDMTSFGFPGCTQRDQPGVLDEACPSVEFPPGAPPMAGCCTASGHCAAMETFMGFGCNSNPDASTWVACGG